MRWWLIPVALLVPLFLCLESYGFEATEPVVQSTNQTAHATVVTGSGYLYGIIFSTDGTNDVMLNGVYDNTAASGVRLLPTNMEITTSTSQMATAIDFSDNPLSFNSGVTVDLHTPGSVNYMVYYRLR